MVLCFGGCFCTRNGKTPMARRKRSWTRQSFYPIRFLGVFLRLEKLTWLQEMMCLDSNIAWFENTYVYIYGKLNVTYLFNTCSEIRKCEKRYEFKMWHDPPWSIPSWTFVHAEALSSYWKDLEHTSWFKNHPLLSETCVSKKKDTVIASEFSTQRNISIFPCKHWVGPFELKLCALTDVIFSLRKKGQT